jgi:Holliday junction resolvase RusA-like endonuclease
LDRISPEFELVLELVLEGNIGSYKPHNYCVRRNAPEWIHRSQVMKYMQNYAPHRDEKARLQEAVATLIPEGFPIITGPVGLEIHHYRQLPKRTDYEPGDYVITRPDESNLTKLIEDVLTGLVYEDDNQVCCRPGVDLKVYDENPRTHIYVYMMQGKAWI